MENEELENTCDELIEKGLFTPGQILSMLEQQKIYAVFSAKGVNVGTLITPQMLDGFLHLVFQVRGTMYGFH